MDCATSLNITVDKGIAARNEVVYVRVRGIDIVVTDHHEPADLVPVGVPVADPKIAEDGPSRELAGVGVRSSSCRCWESGWATRSCGAPTPRSQRWAPCQT